MRVIACITHRRATATEAIRSVAISSHMFQARVISLRVHRVSVARPMRKASTTASHCWCQVRQPFARLDEANPRTARLSKRSAFSVATASRTSTQPCCR